MTPTTIVIIAFITLAVLGLSWSNKLLIWLGEALRLGVAGPEFDEPQNHEHNDPLNHS